jgi:predicted PurR-regulated permease PerM
MWVRLAVGVAIFVLFLWLSYLLRQILIPLMLAFIVAYIFDPVIDFLEERKVPRAAGIGGILLLIIILFAAALFVVIPRVVIQTTDLIQSFQKGFPELQERLLELAAEFGGSALAERISANIESLFEALKGHVPQMLESVSDVLGAVVSGTLGVVGWIVNFLLFAVVSVYLLLDFDKITEKTRDLIPPAYKEKTLEILRKIDENLRAFFRGQIVVCTFLATFYFIGLSILGVPYALPIALAGGYGQIVPYLGTALAVLPAAVFALIKFGDWWHPLGALGVIALGQTMEGFVITPRIMSEKVGLHPVVIILAILVFSQLLGFLGVLFAVPLAAILKVLVEDAVARYKKSSLFAEPDSD